MAYQDFTKLRISSQGGIARATIDHPPINLADLELLTELDRFTRLVRDDPEVRVVVIDSADPEFFVAHADVTLIQALPTEDAGLHDEPSFFQTMVDRLRTMPKVTIAVIEGIARGGGSELALSCDLRFAELDKAVLAQPEVAVGIIPGGGGTQRLPTLMGRARALEVICGGEDIDAATAERWGYVNRALPRPKLGAFVDDLAHRIASFPGEALARAKAAVDTGLADPARGLLVEDQQFRTCLGDPETSERMEEFMAAGGQTREVELDGFPIGDR